MDKKSKIVVFGHTGLLGSAICRRLASLGYYYYGTKHAALDLCDQAKVELFFSVTNPEYVFMAAGRVGGIKANMNSQADFLYENTLMGLNVIHAAAKYNVKKLLYVGSSCVYPNDIKRPIREMDLLKGPLEPTNEGYALSKIACIKLCQYYREKLNLNFISAMPCNLYGVNDNFDEVSSHVIPGMIRKFHDAKRFEYDKVVLWGTGQPRREFMHVDDCADGLLYAMLHYGHHTPINIGTGQDITIAELATIIKRVVGYDGAVFFDVSVPDGTMRKVLDITKIKELDWERKFKDLEVGLREVYEANQDKLDSV